jgi:hypothetical protein
MLHRDLASFLPIEYISVIKGDFIPCDFRKLKRQPLKRFQDGEIDFVLYRKYKLRSECVWIVEFSTREMYDIYSEYHRPVEKIWTEILETRFRSRKLFTDIP